MPNFKPKANKKLSKHNKLKNTLDNKHNEKMKEFKQIEETDLPALKKEKAKIKRLLKKTKNLDKKIELENQLFEIRKQIGIQSNKKKNYLINNSKFIFNYFERKKEIGNDNSKKKILHSFFNKEIKMEKTDTNNDVNNYLKNIDDNYVNLEQCMVNYEYCEKQGCKGEMIPVEYSGLVICNDCGCH